MVIKEYLQCFLEKERPALFDAACSAALANVAAAYGERESAEVIYETALDEPGCAFDFSFRVDTPKRLTKEYWLEMDAGIFLNGLPEAPCCFVDASFPGADSDILRELSETAEISIDADRFIPMLSAVRYALDGRSDGLFQLGVMKSRGETDRIRVFPSEMRSAEVIPFLTDLSYAGDTGETGHFLAAYRTFFEKDRVIPDFDLFPDRIGTKTGINFGIEGAQPERVILFLTALAEEGLCVPEKAAAVSEWYGEASKGIGQDISHFKAVFESGRLKKLKAYFRQYEIRDKREQKALKNRIEAIRW